jgi:S-adenosylhomocysteine hydrolase
MPDYASMRIFRDFHPGCSFLFQNGTPQSCKMYGMIFSAGGMATPLRGKVAIKTGGGQGIGKATAKTFMEMGCAVILADNDEIRSPIIDGNRVYNIFTLHLRANSGRRSKIVIEKSHPFHKIFTLRS